PSRYHLDFLRVRQQQFESGGFQNVPHRFPIHARRLHRHVSDSFLLEPSCQFPQVGCHRPETARLLLRLSFLADQRAGRNAGFVDIQSATTFVHDSHDILLLRRHAEDVGNVESPSRAPQANLGIAQFRLKADNSWCHCNVRIKLVIGLAVATAAPSKGRSPCREMARSDPIQQAGHLGFLFMIRGVGKTWGTSSSSRILSGTYASPFCERKILARACKSHWLTVYEALDKVWLYGTPARTLLRC